MSDYYVIPEIERALIVFVSYPDHASLVTSADDAERDRAREVYQKLVERQLKEAASVEAVNPYIFFEPDEVSEEAEEWLEPYGDKFAIAAQMPGTLADRFTFVLRRIFSRNVTKKAVVVGPYCPGIDRSRLEQAFAQLDRCDAVIGATNQGEVALIGVSRFQPDLFQQAERKPAEQAEDFIAILRENGWNVEVLPSVPAVKSAKQIDGVWPEWNHADKS